MFLVYSEYKSLIRCMSCPYFLSFCHCLFTLMTSFATENCDEIKFMYCFCCHCTFDIISKKSFPNPNLLRFKFTFCPKSLMAYFLKLGLWSTLMYEIGKGPVCKLIAVPEPSIEGSFFPYWIFMAFFSKIYWAYKGKFLFHRPICLP